VKADKIAIETAKTSKVTAVFAVMSVFYKKKCNKRSADSGSKKLSCQKAESADFPEENPAKPEIFLRQQGKAGYQKN
jgi:hypothetical protein